MKHLLLIITITILLMSSCTSQKKLAYLNNLPKPNSEGSFPMDIPNYHIQPRDALYITAKAMSTDGTITDLLSSGSATASSQDQSGGYLTGYVVNPEGNIVIPAIGTIKVYGLTLEETRKLVQTYVDKVFNNTTVDCKLLSFRVTVIGEVKTPGSILTYGSYLTVLEAIGRASGIGDYGDREKILVIRTANNETRTYNIDLQDKKILTSEAYFLQPNDVIIVQPVKQKVLSLNAPVFGFILSTISSTISTALLLIYLFK